MRRTFAHVRVTGVLRLLGYRSPVRLAVVGPVPLLNGGDAMGLSSERVTPLAAGPSARLAYRSAPTELAGRVQVNPIALADLGDNDNYTQLCLDTDTPAQSVTVKPGVAADPRGETNPETSVRMTTDPERVR